MVTLANLFLRNFGFLSLSLCMTRLTRNDWSSQIKRKVGWHKILAVQQTKTVPVLLQPSFMLWIELTKCSKFLPWLSAILTWKNEKRPLISEIVFIWSTGSSQKGAKKSKRVLRCFSCGSHKASCYSRPNSQVSYRVSWSFAYCKCLRTAALQRP